MAKLNKYGEIKTAGCPKCGCEIKLEWMACPRCGCELARSSTNAPVNHAAAARRRVDEEGPLSRLTVWLLEQPFVLLLVMPVGLAVMFVWMNLHYNAEERRRDEAKQSITVVLDGTYAISSGSFLDAYRDEMPLVRLDLVVDRNITGPWEYKSITRTQDSRAVTVFLTKPGTDRGWNADYVAGSSWRVYGSISRSSTQSSQYYMVVHRSERLQ